MKKHYDIVVIGGGHAGLEAAHIASSFSLKVALISIKDVPIGSAPCNPSIGGVGKGQVVKELDCLGALMPRIADKVGIQYRTLNESKGYAVQSTRVQIDKIAYERTATEFLENIDNLDIHLEKVESVVQSTHGYYEIKTDISEFISKKVIVTVGTFLNGKLHRGLEVNSGGRDGVGCSTGIKDIFSEIQSRGLRFKTGTPPRINASSIDFDIMEIQPSDPETLNFSLLSHPFNRSLEQLSCYLAYTNENTVRIISDNKESSPMYNGQIEGTGARYCPSIEDKVYRYPNKFKHHVFIEPESHELDTYYPSGISSSLPAEIQNSFIKTIQGLENAKIDVYGYAVEYDVVDTTKLDLTLQHNSFQGLYFAGQVNGTSGYEEAAGQGYVAGVNAALSVQNRDSFTLNRHDSYIGVMIDDLVSNLRDEPYRLFTARAENRLKMREDNTFVRIAPYRFSLGLDQRIDKILKKLLNESDNLSNVIQNTVINKDLVEFDSGLKDFIAKKDKKLTISDLLKLSFVDPVYVLQNIVSTMSFSFDINSIRFVAISSKYSEYIEKSQSDIQKIQKNDEKFINCTRILSSENISYECKERIKQIMPQNFGQLRRINGIRQATLAVVASGRY